MTVDILIQGIYVEVDDLKILEFLHKEVFGSGTTAMKFWLQTVTS